MIPRVEPNFTTTKQETSTSTTTTTTATTWSRSKDPRIVRVSRALGSKDRHSKVCTVRGLRDRRVRLSVPTAIQLYDLQDRLGLSQPSKVVDWLLNAAKHEIDELPPLQFPHEDSLINPNFHPMMSSFRNFTNSQSAKHGLKSKGNHVSGETSVGNETGWVRDEEEARFNLHNQGEMNNFLDRQNIFSSIPNYNSFVRSSWGHDTSNLTLNHHHDHHDHQPSISLGLTAHQNHDLHNFSFLQSGPSGLVSNQVLVYNQPGISTPTQPYFPQTNTGFDTKALNNFQTSSEMSNPVRPFEFSATANLLPWQNNNAASEENN